jgi:YHS domain-containing protein
LKALYGSRVNTGVAVFVTIRPAAMTPAAHAGHAAPAAGGGMVMVQTSLDPSRLTCSPAVDRNTAAKTTYEGKTYYFCSVADRDRFLTNPKMSLSMMPPK